MFALKSVGEILGGFCDGIVCAYLIDHHAALFNYKVKITGHVKGIGDNATMEGNTSKQLSEDLAIILSNSKDKQASKVSVVGCGSSQCDKGNNSFVSNLEKDLRSKIVLLVCHLMLDRYLRCLVFLSR
jgi:hypothetical protein